MKKYKWIIILLNLVLLLGYFTFTIAKKETILKDGTLVLLELAPVDPRSLMQGDYMTLRYAISENIKVDSVPTRGYCVVQLQPDGVANKVRLQESKTPLKANEKLIKYTAGEWDLNLGAESFFFEEGQAEKYENAKYGGVKIDDEGNSLLVGLYDAGLEKIE